MEAYHKVICSQHQRPRLAKFTSAIWNLSKSHTWEIIAHVKGTDSNMWMKIVTWWQVWAIGWIVHLLKPAVENSSLNFHWRLNNSQQQQWKSCLLTTWNRRDQATCSVPAWLNTFFQQSRRWCHLLLSLPHSYAASHTSILDTWCSQGHGGFYCWQ